MTSFFSNLIYLALFNGTKLKEPLTCLVHVQYIYIYIYKVVLY